MRAVTLALLALSPMLAVVAALLVAFKVAGVSPDWPFVLVASSLALFAGSVAAVAEWVEGR